MKQGRKKSTSTGARLACHRHCCLSGPTGPVATAGGRRTRRCRGRCRSVELGFSWPMVTVAPGICAVAAVETSSTAVLTCSALFTGSGEDHAHNCRLNRTGASQPLQCSTVQLGSRLRSPMAYHSNSRSHRSRSTNPAFR